MSEDFDTSSARDALVRAAPSLVQLEVAGHTASAFVATARGHVVTSLHSVAGARAIDAVLADGIRTQIAEVAALDERRDLAVLRLSRPEQAPALEVTAGPLPGEGDSVHVLRAMRGPAPDITTAQVRAVQVLGDWLTLLELSRALPEEASGGPVLDARGAMVGMATAALTSGRALGLVIPSRYVAALLRDPASLPLSALEAPRRRAGRVRQVPHHPLSLLDGAGEDTVDSIATHLGQAINAGAPAYNRGDVSGCYQLYARTAEHLILAHTECPGALRALRDGLLRCESLMDVDDRAWALRDTFDGLLDVIGRWLQSRGGPPRAPRPPKSYVN